MNQIYEDYNGVDLVYSEDETGIISSPLFLRMCSFVSIPVLLLVSSNVFVSKFQLVLVQVVIVGLALATVLFGFIGAGLKIKMPREAWLTTGFTLWCVTGFFVTKNIPHMLGGYKTLLKTLGLYLIFVNIVRSRKDLMWMAFGYLVSVLGLLFMNFEVLQAARVTGMERAGGTAGDANALAAFAIFGGMSSLMFFHKTKSTFTKILFLVPIPIAFYVITATGSRSGIIGSILCAGLVYWWYIRGQLRGKSSYAKLAGLIIGTILIVGVLYYLAAGPFWSRLEKTFGFSEYGQVGGEIEGDIRIRMMIGGLKLMSRHPLIGVGFRQFPFAVTEVDQTLAGFVIHNTWVAAGCSAGVPGLALFLGAWVILLVRTQRLRKNPHILILDSGLISLCSIIIIFLTFHSFFFANIGEKALMPMIGGITGYLSELSQRFPSDSSSQYFPQQLPTEEYVP